MTPRRKIFTALHVLFWLALWAYCLWHVFHPPAHLSLLPAFAGAAVAGFALSRPFWQGVAVFVIGWCIAFALPVNADAFAYGGWLVLAAYPVALFGVGFIRALLRDRAPERKIIGLNGYGKAGKDTAAAGLVADGWTRVAVSDKIAELALRINPLIEGVEVDTGLSLVRMHHPEQPVYLPPVRLSVLVDALGWTAAKDIPQVRELLQDLGTGVRDIIDPNAWVNATMRDLPEGNLVFTSVRFPNEAEALTKLGGKIVRVNRPGVAPVNGNITETALDHWDFDAVLVNDAAEEDAQDALRRIAADL